MEWMYPVAGMSLFFGVLAIQWLLLRRLNRRRTEMFRDTPVRLVVTRLYGRGFGAYLNGSAANGQAVIMADLHAILNLCESHPELSWKQVMSETCVHELLHVFEDLLDREFDDEEIERLLESARKDRVAQPQ